MHPTANASTISPCDWTIPNVCATPVYIQPSIQHSPEVETHVMRAGCTIHRHRVTPGERMSLLSCQNREFELTISRKANAPANEDLSDTKPPTESHVISDGNYLTFYVPNSMSTIT